MRHALSLLALLTLAIPPAAAQSGSFGTSLAFVDGDLIIAEPNTTFREGSVYVFRKAPEGWRTFDRLTAPDAQRADGFGSIVASNGSELFIGQRNGPIHVFTNAGGSWNATGTIEGDGTSGIDPGCSSYGYCGTDFGIALATHGDWLLVGAPGAPPPRRRNNDEPEPERDPGSVYAYHRGTDGAWSLHSELRPEGGSSGDRFGSTILIDGNRALVGAPLWKDAERDLDAVGRVWEYRLEGNSWKQAGSVPFGNAAAANFGSSMAMGGGLLAVGAPGWEGGWGLIRLYSQGEAGWENVTEQALSDGAAGDRFGSGVAVADNGEIWVGAPTLRENETGSVFRFYNGPDSPLRYSLEDTVERDAFGSTIVSSGNMVAVTAPGMHHQSGSVHVYERTADGWSDGEMLVSPPDALGAIIGERQECEDGKIGLFDCDEVELLSFVPNSILRAGDKARGVRTNDNWGWTDPDTGREYALVGRNDGTSFIDITDPANPVLIGDLPKPWGTPPSQLWRDIKTFKNHAFIVADGAGDHGMQVFDLTRLRTVASPPEIFEPDVHYRGVASSHNIVINETTGFAYAVGNSAGGETCGGGLHMIDVNDPLNPTFAGCSRVGERGTHDSQCVIYEGPDVDYQGHEICLNSNGRYFEIADVSDKDSPVQLSTASSPGAAYIHQGWLTPDHRYFYQDDESDVIRGSVETTRTLIWDLSDLEDPVLINEFMGSMPASAHNLYLKDGYAYQANYRYGLHVLDITDPENPVEAGFFDTSPYQEGPGFSGAWSTYPFFESGTVIVTSLQEGLFVLRKKREAF